MNFKKALKEDAFEIGEPDKTPDRMGASGIQNGQQIALKNYTGSTDPRYRNLIINWVRKNFPNLTITVDNFADVITTSTDLINNPALQPLSGQGIFFKVADEEGISAEKSKRNFFYCVKNCKAGSKAYSAGQVYEIQ